jgi:hypothetical protein
MDSAQFPWRPLGALLVEQGLLTGAELELALAEQRRTGRVLGEILVGRGYVSGLALARALADQHGVELRPKGGDKGGDQPTWQTADRPEAAAKPRQTWRPLGKLLVESGFLTEGELDRALAEQLERPELRLGELLVERGYLSGPALARALAEQHGVDLAPEKELGAELKTVISHAPAGQSVYRVYEVALEPAYQTGAVLYESGNFLEAADFAAEFVERRNPEALEIRKGDSHATETVWTYSESRATAAAESQEKLVNTFGFDVTRWGKPR